MKSNQHESLVRNIFLQLSGFIILTAIAIAPFGVRAITYNPGETLNPSCGPTDPSCGVVPLGPDFTTPINIANGSVSSSLRADGLYIATSTSNLSGLFFVDSSGNVSASGTLQIFGNTNLSGLTFTNGTSTNFFSSALSFSNASGTSVTSTNLYLSHSYTQSASVNPVIVGGIEASSTYILSGASVVKVQGKYAYVGTDGDSHDWFSVIDISDPYYPMIVGVTSSAISAEGEPGSGNMNGITDISIVGTYAYVLSAWDLSNPHDYLHILDISDPSAPIRVSELFITTTSTQVRTNAQRVVVVGEYAYITNPALNTMFVVDIADRKNPTFVGSLTSSTLFGPDVLRGPRGIAVAGKYAYLTSISIPGTGSASLVVADVSNPLNPTVVGSVSVTTTATSTIGSVAVSGRYAYLTDFLHNALYIVDISSSTNPRVVGSVSDLNRPSTLHVAGKYAYVGSSVDDSLRIIDISSSTNPIIVGGVQDSMRLDGVRSVFVAGHYAYIAGASQNGGLFIVDIGGIDAPSANIGALQSSNISVTENIIIGNNAYVSNALNVGAGGIMTDGLLSGGALNVNMKINPKIVGGVVSSTALEGAYSVAISGKYAYVASYWIDSLYIIDISNPMNPTIVGGVVSSTALSGAVSVAVSGKYAYVVSVEDDSLRIIDISNPTAPSIVGGVKDGTNLNGAHSVYVSGKYAYVANYLNDSLRIIDISNPTAPSIVGGVTSTLLEGPRSVYVSGKYAYVANYLNDSLRIIDISNPTAPSIIGGIASSTALNGAYSVYVSGKYAYVANEGDDSLRIIDISNPTTPSIVGGVKDTNLLNGASSVYVSGKYAYVANEGDDSLRIIDISSSTNPTIVGGVRDATNLYGATSVYVSGKYAYVANQSDNSLRIIDIGGIDAPVANIGALQVSTLNVTDNLTVANNAYVSNGLNVGSGGIMTDGLVSAGALDVSMSIDPVIVGTVASSTLFGEPQAMFVSGKYAFIADYNEDAFIVIDVSNPTIPTVLGRVVSPSAFGGASSVYVSGKYAYVTAAGNNTFTIVDISNYTNPTIISSIESSALLNGVQSVYVSGKYAYVAAAGNDALRIIDISSPTAPVVVGGVVSTTALNTIWKVYVSGEYAYVATAGDDSMRIIDISNPLEPMIVGGVKNGTTYDFARDIYVSGKYAYVVSYNNSTLHIIDISSSTAPVRVGYVQDSSNPWGGLLAGASSVYVSGKYAYVTAFNDSALRIVDISSSTNPRIVGGVKDETNLANPITVFISGKYAYVANASWAVSMAVIDIGGIDAPVANIGALQVNTLNVTDNFNVANDAYITNGLVVGGGGIKTDGGIALANTLSQVAPSDPVIVGTTSVLEGAESTYVSGKYAYVTGGFFGNSLTIVDISNPSIPVVIGTVVSSTDLNGSGGVYVSGKYAYVVNYNDGSLRIIDVSSPANPVIVGGVKNSLLINLTSVYVSGRYAYVASENDALRIIDISNPTNPVIVGGVASSTALNGPQSVYVSGKYAYVASNGSDSLSIIDISNPIGTSTIVGQIASSTALNLASSVYVSGRYAYVVNPNDNSLRIIDVSSSTAPRIVGGVKDPVNLTYPLSVQVSGRYAYVVNPNDNSLRIIDVSSSTAPRIVGGVTSETVLDNPRQLFVSGKYAYVPSQNNVTLSVIDIGGIDAPSANIGSLQSSNISVTENLTVGNNAYITNGLNVGMGGIMTDGGLSAAGTTTLSGLVVSSSLVYMPNLAAPGATSDYLCFDTGGRITHQAGNCTVSSERFKHDISDWNNGLSTVLELRPVTYKRNHDDVEELGLIAEEVDLINKHLVIYEPNSTTPRSVDYARLVIPLISAIQEQQMQIDGLLLTTAGVNSSTPRTMSEEELLYAANRPIASALTYLVNRLSDGAIIIKDFLAERVTAVVGVFERIQTHRLEVEGGIQMKDKSTGEVYCIIIDNGEITKIPGACEGSIDSENIQLQLPSGTVQEEGNTSDQGTVGENSEMLVSEMPNTEIIEESLTSSAETNNQISAEEVEETVVDILFGLFTEGSSSTTQGSIEGEIIGVTVE